MNLLPVALRITFHGLAILVAICALLLVSPTITSANTNESNQADALVNKLAPSASVPSKLQAVRQLIGSEPGLSSHLVLSLARVLCSDSDPTVRSTVASAFAELADKYRQSQALGLRTPQIIHVLSLAYDQEANPKVRRAIIEAAAEFDDPAVALLLNKALQDKDQEVRQVAQQGKHRRHLRQFAQAAD